jgi:hypothetical protein
MGRDSLIRRIGRAANRHAGDTALITIFAAALVIGMPSGAGRSSKAIAPAMAASAADEPAPIESNELSARVSAAAFSPVKSRVLPDGLRTQRKMAASLSAVMVPDSRDAEGGISGSAEPVVAICIDDLGADTEGTTRAMALLKDVTLAFLPYSRATPAMAQEALQLGHEVLAHVPMEPIGPLDPGPMTLKVGAPDNAERLAWALARVPGLSGINNHEGSKFSTDAASLTPVAQMLSERHLFFFDSRTIGGSRIVPVAHKFGVASAGRDVFLDNVVTESAVRARLDELAAKARKTGVAIAIGHPHAVTLRILASWLDQDHGVRLVPVSEAIRLKTERGSIMAAK